MTPAYLDWAATAIPDPDILDAVRETAASAYANPSSKHAPGRTAARVLREARDRCAHALDIDPGTVVFTSGGTESNNMVVFSLLDRPSRGRVIVSNIEHPSCAEPAAHLEKFGWKIDRASAAPSGLVRPETVEALLTPDTHMVLIMAVNNETGAVQPIEEIVSAVRAFEKRGGRKIHIHTDAVQAFGKIPFPLRTLDVDSAALSAHKFSGPRGAGMLYCKNAPGFLFRGGGQEGSRRHGTENLPGIHGLSLALAKAVSELDMRRKHAADIKDYMIRRLSGIKNLSILPRAVRDDPGAFSPNILAVSLPPIPGEVLVRMLSDGGFAVSTGSACSANRKKGSRVLEAMGIDPRTALSLIRISTGYTTRREDIEEFCSFLGNLNT